LGPNSASVHQTYAFHLRSELRLDDALREIRLAQELDPLSSTVSQELARTHIEMRNFDNAIEEARRVIDRDPGFYRAYLALGTALGGKGMHEESVAALRQAHQLAGRDPQPIGALGYALAVTGAKAEAAKLLEQLRDMSAQGHYVAPIFPAHIAVGLRDFDAVFHWLEKAYNDRTFQLGIVPSDYRFDSIRSSPRYAVLIGKISPAK